MIVKSKKNQISIILTVVMLLALLSGCANPAGNNQAPPAPSASGTESGAPVVYMTSDISPEGLIAVYKALGREADGKVEFKIHFGEPGGNYFLSPDLIKDLVQSLDGTIVESNTAGGIGSRGVAAMHLQVAEDHGFTAIAPVEILDANGEISLPIENGKHLKEDIIGAGFQDYDFHIVLSHFKGHAMGGFGGAIKNMSIGYASSNGKGYIHSAGESTTWAMPERQEDFLESMAEAAKAVADAAGDNILYINVMNNLSIDCDCDGNPAAPELHDIGILASLDPVALDRACVDLIYQADDKDSASLRERIESMNGTHTLDYAAEIGLGSLEYTLVNIDD